jgi:hypothetical protein
MRQIVEWQVSRPCRPSLFLGRHYGPSQYGKLWPSLGCYADPPIMLGRTSPLLEKACGALYLKYLSKPVSGDMLKEPWPDEVLYGPPILC